MTSERMKIVEDGKKKTTKTSKIVELIFSTRVNGIVVDENEESTSSAKATFPVY